jgi:energy-coupling factor transporter ATP-binding protein EcfA2
MPSLPGNLPEPLSSFRGRNTELEQVDQAIDSSRLVTLIGPGGVGKTRLAVAAAARRRDQHPGGVWLVELAGVSDPAAVAPAAAAARGAAAMSRPLDRRRSSSPATSPAAPSSSSSTTVNTSSTRRLRSPRPWSAGCPASGWWPPVASPSAFPASSLFPSLA